MVKNIFLILLFIACSSGWGTEDHDRIGGWKKVSSEPTTFFYVEEIEGKWWFMNPGGNAFLTKGVNHISYFGDHSPALNESPYHNVTRDKYGSADRWAGAAADNLRRWNFNTVGAWSSSAMREQGMAYTLILDIAVQAGANWQEGIFPDVFSDRFQRLARAAVRSTCRQLRNDRMLLGYFTDNELRWGPDWRNENSLLIDYLQMEPETAGYRRAIQFLKKSYESIHELNNTWKLNVSSFQEISSATAFPASERRKESEEEFVKLVAERYFRICREEILDADPNHLILGCRFAGNAPRPVLEVIGSYIDVVSFNTYNYHPPKETLEEIYQLTGCPIMITEFSFKAMDSGLPNTKGAGKPVETQKDRARRFSEFVTELVRLPYIIGYHWFEYVDEPAEGRFDGENSNYGLVNIKDEPWEILTQEMRQTNLEVEAIHAGIDE